MGLAQEWLSEGERESLAMELLSSPKKHGGRIAAECPFHAERSRGGAFSYVIGPDYFKCYSCGAKGDLIDLYGRLRGTSTDQAEYFKEFKERFGPDEAGRPRRRPPARQQRPGWRPRETEFSPELWSAKAGLFVEHSRERLAKLPNELDQLRRWGLDLGDAWLCGFGWNDKWKSFDGKAWGIEAKISLPPGLVIPYFRGERVVRIKIRRPEPEAAQRYWLVNGSSRCLPLYGWPFSGRPFDFGASGLEELDGPAAGAVMVVETERDAAMLWSKLKGRGWAFLGTGGASQRPCAELHEILIGAEAVAVTLDLDEAGYKAWDGFWSKQYPHAFRWPVPREWGKDPGEAAEKGFDFESWLAAAQKRAGIRI